MSDRDSERESESEGGSAPRVSRRSILAGIGTTGLLGAAGTASANPQGQVGRSGDPLNVLYTNELNGPITDEGSGPQAVTSLVGTDLAIDGSGALEATAARLDVDDGTTSVQNVEGITFGAGLSVTDDGDGTVTIDR